MNNSVDQSQANDISNSSSLRRFVVKSLVSPALPGCELNVKVTYFRSSSRSRSHRRDSSSSVDQADPAVAPDDVNVEWSGDGVRFSVVK